MTTTETGLAIAIWLGLCSIIAAFVARKRKVTVIRVPLPPYQDNDFGGHLFVVKKKRSAHMVLGRYGDHADVIEARIIDGKLQVKCDDDKLNDITSKTEGKLWKR